jgi:hypothetical protein
MKGVLCYLYFYNVPHVVFFLVDKTSNINKAPNRQDTIDLLFQTGPELPDSLGRVPSDVGWKDQYLFQTWYYHDR